ncbi:MAG TPA: outer membrane beta-barrel protein [Vicinamibacteria bacterium]|nr:outer membrane beta-barrel protein [Vicinamibacteria bacterium]
MILRVGVLLVLLAAHPVHAQEAPPVPPTQSEAPAAEERPGRFRVGPFYLTPYIHIGTLGYDSNALYSASNPEGDFTASGGPGLEIVLPIRRVSRFTLDGALDYLYYAEHDAERRLNGYASARLDFDARRDALPDEYRPPKSAFLEATYDRTSERPNLEVDERVPRTIRAARAGLSRPLFGRMGIDLGGALERHEVDEPTEFVGNDLQRTMTGDRYLADAGLRYSVTIKTSLAVRGGYQADRFDLDPARDGDFWTLLGGLETDASALIAGHALFGTRRFVPRSGAPSLDEPEIDVDAMWNVTSRTRLGGAYKRSLGYTAFVVEEGAPTQRTWWAEARAEKDLGERFDLRASLRRTRLATQSEVTVESEDGSSTTAQRDDRTDEAYLSFGYRFRSRLRISIDARYLERSSNFDDFGIDGLLVGFAVEFEPGSPRGLARR